MDRVIWDFQNAEEITALLRAASAELENCRTSLRGAQMEGEQQFRRNAGLSRRIMEQMQDTERRMGLTAERISVLSKALERAEEAFLETERELVARGQSDLTEEAEGPETFRLYELPGLGPLQPVFIRIDPRSIHRFVPDWLDAAVNEAFR